MGDSNMRIRQMDGLRAVAALAVVMIHVSAGRMNPVGVSCNQTARFAVPLFIMLSGYGHMHSWLQHSGQSAVQTAKRRLKRVLPAYLVWSVLYLAVDAVFGKPHAHPIKNILTGGSYVHLYYIFILVQLILLSELFCRAVERHPAVTLLLSAGLTFGMEIVLYLLTVGQLQWQFPVAPIGLFVCWPLFYNIGAWLAKSGLSNRLRLRVCLPLWALSAVLVLLAEEQSAAAYKMGLRPDTTVYTLLTWAVLWSLFSRLPEIPKPLQFIARHSFGLYLAHPLVLRLWNAWAVRQIPVIYLHLWQMFALALAGGLAIAVTLSYLPFGEYLGGAKRTKKILQRRA